MRGGGSRGDWGMPGLLAVPVAVALLAVGASSATSAVGITFTVNSTGDGADANLGDGVCADAVGNCTLRAAISQSNTSVGFTDTIEFALPTPPFSIVPATELPAVTDPVAINGATQPGFVDRPIVELSGNALPGGSRGLRLLTGDSLVRGLVINRFSQGISILPPAGGGDRIVGNFIGTDITGTVGAGRSLGIHVQSGGDHVIGGSTALDRNLISGNPDIGVLVANTTVGKVSIRGNRIGTNASGAAALEEPAGQRIGVQMGLNSITVVGGPDPSDANVISANDTGVQISGGSGHEIAGNKIGTDPAGQTAVPNGNAGIIVSQAKDVRVTRNIISGNGGAGLHLTDAEDAVVQGNNIGVDVDGLEALPNGNWGLGLSETTGVLIGGTTEDARNIISANRLSGIQTFNFPSRNTIQGNFIGIGVDGRALGNGFAGIFCCGLPNNEGRNVIGGLSEGAGNVIAHNVADGILVGTVFGRGPEASILRNSIYLNGGLGIDLRGNAGTGATENDPGDEDAGPNDAQNFPVVKGVTVSGGQTLADVEFNSTPNSDFRFEFFRNRQCDGSHFGEGERFVGARDARTDAAGSWSGVVALSGGTAPTEVITATATHLTEPGVTLVGSTSEFSECLADLAISKSDESDPIAIGEPLTYTIDVANAGPTPATAVRVTDTLPSGITVISITTSQGTCTRAGSIVTCNLGLIPRNGTARLTIVVNAGPTPRELTNTAGVSSELRDHLASNNSATATTQVVTELPGTIVVRKETLPDWAQDTFSFSLPCLAEPIGAGEGRSCNVRAGEYRVTEATRPGWDLTSLNCDDSNSTVDLATRTATFRVASGETVSCTFTNAKRGTIIVKKLTVPAGSTTSFAFTPSYGAGFSLKHGESNRSTLLVPGQGYSVRESVPAGWSLIATCDDGSSVASIDLGPDETVTCTFTNTAVFPGSGFFVIGDMDSAIGAAVTFWGAQWWKLNSLSGGSAPAAFKGFAKNTSGLGCGMSWTTDPGNSPPPPAGPLPSHIGVIVASSIVKSGSMITGNAARIVIVKTNPGYAANPGHAGTGTVVASIC